MSSATHLKKSMPDGICRIGIRQPIIFRNGFYGIYVYWKMKLQGCLQLSTKKMEKKQFCAWQDILIMYSSVSSWRGYMLKSVMCDERNF